MKKSTHIQTAAEVPPAEAYFKFVVRKQAEAEEEKKKRSQAIENILETINANERHFGAGELSEMRTPINALKTRPENRDEYSRWMSRMTPKGAGHLAQVVGDWFVFTASANEVGRNALNLPEASLEKLRKAQLVIDIENLGVSDEVALDAAQKILKAIESSGKRENGSGVVTYRNLIREWLKLLSENSEYSEAFSKTWSKFAKPLNKAEEEDDLRRNGHNARQNEFIKQATIRLGERFKRLLEGP